MTQNMAEILAREAEEAEARAEAEELGKEEPLPAKRGRRRADDPSQVYSVRIPVSRLGDLRRVADAMNKAPSALIREWIIERLDRERPEISAPSDIVFKSADGQHIVVQLKTVDEDAVRAAAMVFAAVVYSKADGANDLREASPYRDPNGPVRLGARRRVLEDLSSDDVLFARDELSGSASRGHE